MNKSLKSVLRPLLPRGIGAQRILGGPLRGYRIVTSWHDYPAAILGRTEAPLLNWFAQNIHPGETWLDIGAHYGYTAIAMSRLVGPQGRVFAFEPMLSTAGHLSQTRRLNNLSQLTVIPLGLAASTGLTVRRLPSVRGMVDSTQPTDGWTETILVACLDELWPQISQGRDQIDGVKIDVQGMEIEVLRGMSALLNKLRPRLVVEVHSGVPRDELLSLIEGLGYSRRALAIEPVEGEREVRLLDDRSYAFPTADR